MKKYLKENLKSIIIMLIFIIVVNIQLPYYIEAPGGTINLTERIFFSIIPNAFRSTLYNIILRK